MPRERRRQLTLRLPPDIYKTLAAEAGRRQIRVMEYIRLCVERGHQAVALDRQIADFRYQVQELAGSQGGPPSGGNGESGPSLSEVRQALKSELGPIRKTVDNLARGAKGGQQSPAIDEVLMALVESAFVSEELLRELAAARKATMVTEARARGKKRVAKVVKR